MKKILVQISLFLVFQVSFAQFSLEHERFAREFSQNLNYTGEIRENGKSISKEFSIFWESDSISNEEKNSFIKTANLMSSKGCSPFPDFVCFTDNLLQIKRKNLDSKQYQNYEKALTKMLTEGKRPNLKNISEYLKLMNSFLAKDIILKNVRTYWKAENNNFEIEYDKEITIELTNINLVGYQGVDSLKIYNTSAKYYPNKKYWEGTGGTIGWERVGYGLDSIKAELVNYNIDMRNISFSADSAVFTNNIFFKEKLLGKVIDKAENIEDPSTSNYPRFTSYQQHFKLDNLFPGLDYEGGFSMRGKKFIGSGTKDNPAKIKIVKNDSVSLVASSNMFLVENQLITTDCTTTLYLNDDSIYHPYLTFRYNNDLRYVELIRSREDMSQVNYLNTYHKIAMDFTWMRWALDRDKIEFNTILAQETAKEALFESLNYYTLERYRSMKKRDFQHPLEVVTNFISSWAGSSEFHLNDFVAWMKYSKPQVLGLIMNLAYQGFLRYDEDTEMITVYQNTWKFIEAHRGVIDSDVIQFYSKTDVNTTNAELSLLNFDLKINGINNVHLSDSQNVKVYPANKRITVKKDMNFVFDGTIQAGQFYFYGTNFDFNYNRFMINLNNCDSIKMVAATDFLDARGIPELAIVQNQLEQVNGQFFIDDPMNKAGRNSFPQYPRFISENKTYVYYDSPKIHNKAYDRNSFYFEVDPFILDSIKGYDRDNLTFTGTLYSADIFPPIRETLVLRNTDFSLGFKTKTPPEGLPLYRNKATYINDIDLSNGGLRGAGKINYLTSKIDADYLLFLPKEMQGHSNNMVVAAQKTPTEFPAAQGKDNTLNWQVEEDQFLIQKKSEDFKLFGEKAILDGDLDIKSTGLNGKGIIDIANARISSDAFNFKKEEINADTSEFALYTQNILDIDFISNNVNSNINFETQKGKFKSNGKITSWRFPKNQYISEMTDMTWHMNKKELEVNIAEEILPQIASVDAEKSPEDWESLFTEGPKFTSIHYQQDSFSFFSPRVIYDYGENLLKAEDVKFVRVADALIYTDTKNEKLEIEKDAVIRSLNNSKIVANNDTKYHTIYSATSKIESRNKYAANGYYDYISTTKEPQKFYLDTVFININGTTQASGKVIESNEFSLSPHFKYQGNINLYADIEHLEFDGATQIVHNCDTSSLEWLKFKAIIDPEDIFIPVDAFPLSINNLSISNSLVLTNTNNVRPTIMKKKGTYDQELLSTAGFLTYNTETECFKFGSKEKILNSDTTGNFLEFNKFLCTTYGEGTFIFSNQFLTFKPNAIGSFYHTPENDTIELNLAMIIDTYFDKNAYKVMADKINSTPGLNGIYPNETTYQKAVYEYLGAENADDWFRNLSMANYSKMPKELQEKFIFTDLSLVWYKDLRAFVHYGPIGVASIGKENVSKQVFGILKIEKTRRGDVFELLLEPDTETSFFLKYEPKNGFTAISTDVEFNSAVIDSKQKQIKIDGVNHFFGIGGSEAMKKFKTDMYKRLKL
ncbi:hypothetical protein LJC11_01855 [Bacteroidales bacterium OttesenSCG-928-I21]|nr:hypothetical protein [Bacteroidales bacterium OttesenSCG-928-I21]